MPHDHELDADIAPIVELLQAHGVETYESCEGGAGHAFAVPTVRFHGHRDEGFRALAVVQQAGYEVETLRRFWQIIDGEPCGPYWEMTFLVAGWADEPPANGQHTAPDEE